MNGVVFVKKKIFCILSVLIVLGLSISLYFIATVKLREENTTMTFQLDELRDRAYVLQKSLDEANELNSILKVQVEKNSIHNEVTEEHYGNYQGNDDFSDIINDNPIDKDYWVEFEELQKSEKFTTLAMGALETKYGIIWEEEVNNALSYLYETLSEQDSLKLKQAQKSWQSFLNDDDSFVSEKFIYTRFFGSQGIVQMEKVRLNRTRERAIELMEFVFSIDKTAVDFVYDK